MHSLCTNQAISEDQLVVRGRGYVGLMSIKSLTKRYDRPCSEEALEAHVVAVFGVEATPFEAETDGQHCGPHSPSHNLPINVDLHVNLPSDGEHPFPPGLRNFVKLCITVQLARAQARRLELLASGVGSLKHGARGSRKEGVNVVDLVVHL